MQYQNDLCAVFRQVLEEEAAEYGRQNRQCNQHYEGIQEGLETRREEVDQRTNDGGQHREDDADILADLDELVLGSVLVDEFLVDVHGKHGIYRVQHRVERGQDRAEHDRRKEAHKRSRNDLRNKLRIRFVHHGYLIALQLKQCIRDNARQSKVHKADNFQKRAVERALLCFLEVLCSKYTLNERLVRTPGLQAEEEQTGKYSRPRNRRRQRIRRSDRVEHIRMVFDQETHTVDNRQTVTACRFAEHTQCEERDHKAADQQADAVYRIRYGNGFQSAEDGVNRADDTDDDAQNDNGLELGYAQNTGYVEDILKYQRTGVQDNRNLYDNVQQDVRDGEPQLRAAVIAQTDQLRDGGNAAFQITRRRKQRQHDTARSRYDLERHRAHAHAPSLSVRADQLLCRQVGQQQRTRDNEARQAASGQKIAVCGALVIVLCFYIRNDCNKYRETDKRRHSPNHWNPPLCVCALLWSDAISQICQFYLLQVKQGRAQVQNLRPPCYKQYNPVCGSVFYSHRPLDFISAI